MQRQILKWTASSIDWNDSVILGESGKKHGDVKVKLKDTLQETNISPKVEKMILPIGV